MAYNSEELDENTHIFEVPRTPYFLRSQTQYEAAIRLHRLCLPVMKALSNTCKSLPYDGSELGGLRNGAGKEAHDILGFQHRERERGMQVLLSPLVLFTATQ